MKATRFFFFGILAFAAVCQAQNDFQPGRILASPRSIQPFTGVQQGQMMAMGQGFGPLDAQSQPVVAETITPEIQALARGLENDPVRIVNYVHDHIRYVFYFGSKKGAALTLLERSGNDFDQCALTVALLRAAGYTNAGYQFGWMLMPYESSDHNDLHHWLTLSQVNTNWLVTSNYLYNLTALRGYPSYDVIPGDTNTWMFQRVWVSLPIGNTTNYVDPAFKVSEWTSGINLTNAMNFSSNGVLTAAAGTDAGNYVTNLSEVNLRGTLTGYTTNLLNYLQANNPNATVQQILGGWSIVPATNTALMPPVFQTTDFGGQVPILSWINEPTNIMSILTISVASTNYQWFMPQLLGQRVSLTYSNNGVARLWQDDTLLLQAQANLTGGTNSVVFLVNHPFGTWDFVNNVFVDETNVDKQSTFVCQSTNATYAWVYAFEPDWTYLQKHQNQLDTYRQQGLSDSSRQVTSETLEVMGLNWMVQTFKSEQVFAAQMGILPQYFHQIGRMAQEGNGYYVDISMDYTGQIPDGGQDPVNQDRQYKYFDVATIFGSALEHGIIEQLQNSNWVAASTVKMLQIANTNGQAVYLASSTNWTTGFNVKSKLINYNSSVLSSFDSLISSGYYLLLPRNGSNHVASGTGTWAGYGVEQRGFNASGEYSMAMLIDGTYHGGYVSVLGVQVPSGFVAQSGQSQPSWPAGSPYAVPFPTAGDPVDTADGTFQVASDDLSLGQAAPRGITFSRYYNSRRRNGNPAGMSYGWVHNYSINVAEVAAPEAVFGETTPAQMAPMLAATCAAINFYNGSQPDPKNWVVTALIAKWGIDQAVKNGASVSLGKDVMQFVKQPDGSFISPAGSTWTLTKPNAYVLQERHGNTFKFNSAGLLTNIVDQYGQSLNVAYNSSNWVQTVTDWKNRSFTFTYSGSPSRLTSISDSTGRSISFGYGGQGDLTSFTDAEQKTRTYVYDTNHQITATLDALNRLIVTNLYDSGGRITTQYTQGDTNKAWQIYWSDWETVSQNPAGNKERFFFDDKTRLVAHQDNLGNVNQTFYDGQDHIVMTVSPLNETNVFAFDGNHNLVYRVDPLGFTNRFVYDSQNNLVQLVDNRGNTNRYGYNTQFSLTGTTNGAGDWVTFAFNGNGTLNNRTDPGGTTSFGYDSYGQRNSITNPGSLGVEGFLNSATGDVLSHTNARGFVTSFQYNNRRQITNTIAPTNITVRLSYDSVGNLQTTTDGRGFTTTSFWSPTTKLLGTVQPSTPQGSPAITNFYDNRDWLVRQLDPLQQPTLFTNNAAGRLVSVTDPLLRTTSFGLDADGRRLATTNAALEVTKQQWDSRGQIAKLTDNASHTVARVYDGAGNQIVMTNRNGKKWQFQFDGANRLTNTVTPLNRQTKLVWNNRGLLQSITEPSTQTASFTYDPKGRLTNRTDSVAVTSYSYDGNDNRTNIVENGKTNGWTFDAYDRISSYRDADGNLIQYKYDVSGNLTNLVYPGGKTVTYFYDSLNRLTNVTDWASRKTTITYDLANRVKSITRPNGTVRLINYDSAGETTNIIEEAASLAPIAFFTMNWNAAARVQWEFAGPLPHSYTPQTRSMTFDDDNRILNFNGLSVGYDLDGNMTSGPLTNNTLTSYTYDARNRLLSAGGLNYHYDPAGNRTAITNGAMVTQFVIDPNAKLSQALMRVKNGVTNYYVYGPGLLYQVTETGSGTNTLTYHYDYRGSTVALTDDNGNVTDRIEYSAYGMMTFRAGTNDTPFLFNGKYGVMSDDNGLLYMRARYYNPYLCRFLNPDPNGFSGGLNFYAYADGNPISYLDPFGLGAASANTTGFWGLFGNGLNNTVSGIGRSMGLGLYDLATMQWSADQWTQIGDQMYSMGTPENPAATPYVMGALGVSAGAVSIAGAAGAWEAAGLPTMSIGGSAEGGSFHAFYSVTANGVTTELEGAYTQVGLANVMMTQEAPFAFGLSTAGNTITGIPILFPEAASATGIPVYNCVTAAGGALVRGWIGIW